MALIQTRRGFLGGIAGAGAACVASVAGGAALVRARSALCASDELETTSVRLVNDGVICEAPLMAAIELLKAEGFTDIRYVDVPVDVRYGSALAGSRADFGFNFALFDIAALEELGGETVLAGVHVGCFELFAQNEIRSIVGLKGKSVVLQRSPPGLLRLMALQVGNAADGFISEQFEAADMHPRQQGERRAAIYRDGERRGKGDREIGVAGPDRLGRGKARTRCQTHKADIGETLGAQ